jgi:hypothetical protein
MAVAVFTTRDEKSKYEASVQPSLVSVSKTDCAARVQFREIPARPGSFYAEIQAAAQEGCLTSFSLHLQTGVPAGQLLLTTVSPLLDVIGAYMAVFVDDIAPTTIGPAMFRKTGDYDAYFCVDKRDSRKSIYIMTEGISGLEGVTADVLMTVNAK